MRKTRIVESDKRWVMVVIAAAIIAIDRLTKLWIVKHIPSGHSIIVMADDIQADACAQYGRGVQHV